MPHAADGHNWVTVSETAFRESQESLSTALTKAKSVETVDVLGAEGAEGKGANGLRQQTSFSLPYAAGLCKA